MNKKINELQDQLELLTKTLREINKDTHILKDIFHNSGPVQPRTQQQFEILAGRATAFKPSKIQMYGISTYPESISINNVSPGLHYVDFEIHDVRIMGAPQLVNYDGSTVIRQRGSSFFFNEEKEIDWQVFGCSAGQGLQFTVVNLHPTNIATLYVHIRGHVVDGENLGRS